MDKVEALIKVGAMFPASSGFTVVAVNKYNCIAVLRSSVIPRDRAIVLESYAASLIKQSREDEHE